MTTTTTTTNDKASNAPWQYAWQRPRWHVVHDTHHTPTSTSTDEDHKDKNRNTKNQSNDEVEGTCLCVASAQVSHEEVPDLDDRYDGEDEPDAAGDSQQRQQQQQWSSLVLTVTVVSSPFSTAVPSSTQEESSVGGSTSSHKSSSSSTISSRSSGDLLVLEILRQPGPTGRDHDDPAQQDDEDGSDAKPQAHSQPEQAPQRLFTKVLRWPGVALGAENNDNDNDENSKNWRHHLPIWLGGIPSSSQASSSREQTVGVVAACLCRRLVEGDQQQAAALDALDTMTFLSLGMDPEVRTNKESSSPLELPGENGSRRDDEEEETIPSPLPELVLACLCSDGSVHVYSPWKLLQLPSAKTEEEKQEDVFANSMSTFLLGAYVFEQLQSNIWPLSQPEATVKLTVPLRKHGQVAAGTLETRDSPDDEERKSEGVSFWDRSVWDPTVDPFTAIYRTEGNVPTHCVAAFEYIVIAGRGKRVKRGRDKTGGSAKEGGFITLLSLRHYAEIRTLFLPFVPTNLSPFAWGGMQFVFVFGGKGVAIAIRVDISISNSIICGEAPSVVALNDPQNPLFPTVSSDQSLLSHQSNRSKTPERKKQKKSRCILHRFQILPIVLPDTVAEDTEALSVAMSTLFGSSPFSSPPRLAMVYRNPTQKVVVMQRALESIDYYRHTSSSPSFQLFRGYRRSRDRRILAIGTSHEPRHIATISPSVESCSVEEAREEVAPATNSEWCHLGQGWCLVGISCRAYFVCWDGATSSRGAFVQELPTAYLSNEQMRGFASDILPENPYAREASTMSFYQGQNVLEDLTLPFTQDAATRNSKLGRVVGDNRGILRNQPASLTEENHDGADDVVKDAIRSISNTGPRSAYSHREKSVRLLSKVPAWSQLDDAAQNIIRLEGQVPAVYVRLQNQLGPPCLLTVRQIYSDNGVATPFHQILSWLSTNKDYFTAASVALDLLRDVGTLRHLWRSFEKIDEDDERTKLEGLLDGIVPLSDRLSRIDPSDPLVQATVTQLADMTVGCLTRGGFAMSSTLEYFLQQDQHYDSSRTCLILAAIAAQAVSDDDDTRVSLMGQNYEVPADQDQLIHDILWPLRCLLQVGAARNNLSAALALVNAAVPDELRRKQHHKQVDSMKLCLALVKLIIGTSPGATELLLDLVDEQERKRFWYSLDHETQLELALILIDDKRPLLRQLEVRSWVLNYLQRCLQQTAARDYDEVPSDWLKDLCTACLANARCDMGPLLSASNSISDEDRSDDGVKEHVRELTLARDALIAGQESGGVDFNLLIPPLLLLQIRNVHWDDKSWVPTQSILNAACDMAGRKTAEELMFAFNGNMLMKQCFLAENICAGANLIGGKDGLVVECCSILIECCGMTMEDAELFLRRDSMNLNTGDLTSSESEKVADDFELSYGHRHVLWLLEEHVLEVKTYGEFDAARGKVDPVFAARVCLRTWFSLTKSQLPSASAWLASWLRHQLEMGDKAVSKKRLACATLARVLLWSAGLDEGNVLAEHMNLESQFLVQLSQGCWSLTESVPPSIADELLAQDAVDGTRG